MNVLQIYRAIYLLIDFFKYVYRVFTLFWIMWGHQYLMNYYPADNRAHFEKVKLYYFKVKLENKSGK